MALQYEIALCSVWWCAGCENVRYFNSVAEQTSYFETLASGKFSPLANFNMGNNVETTIHYKDTSDRTPEELVACNYAVIRHRENESGDYIYRYFFARCSQDSGRQIRAELSLDDIQTNYFRYKNTISPCVIERAHLNRWSDASQAVLSFDTSPKSKLFKSEGVSLPKRTISRNEQMIYPEGAPQTAIDFFNNNIAGWVYIFIEPRTYKAYSAPGTGGDLVDTSIQNNITYIGASGANYGFSCEWAILFYPIFRTGAQIIIDGQVINQGGLEGFRENNNDTSYFYAIKVSRVPPFRSGYNYSYDASGNILTVTQASPAQANVSGIRTSDSGDGLGYLRYTLTAEIAEITGNISINDDSTISGSDLNFTFNKSSVMGNRNPAFNPKLLSADVSELAVYNGSSVFMYDILKIGKSNPSFRYREVIFADINRSLCTYDSGEDKDNAVYTEDTLYNYTGASASDDYSLPIRNDQLQSFLASNKNFYLQRNIGMMRQITGALASSAQSKISTAGNVLSGNIMGAVQQEIGSRIGTMQSAFNIMADRINSNLTLDNMENAPDALQNANGNVLYNIIVAKDRSLKIAFETRRALDCDIKPYDDFLYMYGFAFNELANISDYDNVRKYFNYIKADIEIISAPISTLEEDRLKERFRIGVRFWNSDNIQYTLENYENALEVSE